LERPQNERDLARSQLNLHTRLENQIINEINREPIRYGDTLQAADWKRKFSFPEVIHRPTKASRKYNCHGLTFASRRTWIQYPSEIAKIILEDDYRVVADQEVLPGDVVVYYKDGDAEHSGTVVRVDRIMGLPCPMILSKWGGCHEVIHPVGRCPFDSQNVIYYRIDT